MKIIRAQTAGFCMGVALALQKLDEAIEQAKAQNKRICTFGPIIHNPQVLNDYLAQGVQSIAYAHEALANDCVIIRAHGIPKEDEATLKNCGANIIDATCPKVKKAQLAIAKATQDGTILLLFGEVDHPEVRGLVSYAHGEAFVFDSLDELQATKLAPQNSYVLASQTTQDQQIFMQIEHYLKTQLGSVPVLATICHATSQRQEEIMRIANDVDAVVIVGGKESGNTRRLADVAASKGVPTWHVETVDELKNENFKQMSTLGLTAGASTPKSLIDAVHIFLEKAS